MANLFRIVVPVPDMAKADAFWGSLLELDVDPVVSTRHYLNTAGAILALVNPAEHGRSHSPSPDWLYFRVPDLEATYARAKELGCGEPDGYEGEGIQEWPWGDRSFYTHDPFGNKICFVDDVRSETPPALARYQGKPGPNLYKTILPTTSLGRAAAFFEELLGLEVDASVPNRHFVYCDSCVLALVNPIEHARGHGMETLEFRPNPEVVYFGVSDLDGIYERAQKLGMKPIPQQDDPVGIGIEQRPWGERSFYGLDPSGNPICFVDDQTLFTGSHDWK